MSITYKWSVSKVQVAQHDGKANVVTNVDWNVQATDDVNNLTASASGVRSLKLGDSFIAYDQLTEQQVLNWCFEPETISFVNDLDGETITVVKNVREEGELQVAGQIARQLAQKESEPALPWVEIPA